MSMTTALGLTNEQFLKMINRINKEECNERNSKTVQGCVSRDENNISF